MPQLSRTCLGCDTPLPDDARYCGMCGTEASCSHPRLSMDEADEDAALELERVRRGLAGRYAIERAVGTGGTATVYLAEDSRHRRKVAVKVLRPEIASLVGSSRFLREIEIAARLQHPHILPVYDSGEAAPEGPEGPRLLFYVMPFAAESLASRLGRGQVPLAEAVRILSQVADALAFAHAQGVVHRDVKPDNVMLAGRHAMVADFGIAKALTVPLVNRSPTKPGVPIGTPYYMAPEQVSGDPAVDGRADQYALGVMAYELITGRRPFGGSTVQEVLAAQILETPEPVDRLRPEAPAALARAVMRCLEKEPGRRWQESDELAAGLEAVALALGSVTPPESALGIAAGRAGSRGVRGVMVAGAVASGLALAAGFVVQRSSTRFSAAPMSDQVSFSGAIGMAAVSPDGRFLAYSSREEGALLVQELAGGPPLEVARGLTNLLTLRWSPDGTRLLAGGWYEGEPGIFVLPRLGGRLRRIRHSRLAHWHPSGSRVSVWDYPAKAILTVDLGSGDSAMVELPGSYDWLYDAEWSPSGGRLAYVTMNEPDRYALRLLTADGAARIVLRDSLAIGSPRWSPEEDAIYYLRGNSELRKLRLKRSTGAPRGEPVTLLDGLQAGSSEVHGIPAPFTITADGRRLLYLKSLDYSNLWVLSGHPLSRSGAITSRRLTGGTALRRGASVSPDGKSVAWLESSKEGTDLFRMPLAGGTAERLTFTGRAASSQAAWSPDGSRLALGVHDGGAVRLATIAADGGEMRLLGEPGLPALGDLAWAPGENILHQVAGNRNFRVVNPASGAESWLLPEGEKGWIFSARPGPDGERVAVFWNRRPEGGVWLLSLRDSSRVLLAEGRVDPIGWSPDGRSVLGLGWDSGGVVRIGLDGRREELGTLPFRVRDADCVSADQAGRGTIVCVVPERVSDVWMVAGFDPELR